METPNPIFDGVNLLEIAQQGQFPSDRRVARREILVRTGCKPSTVSLWVNGMQLVPTKYCALIGLPPQLRYAYLDEALDPVREARQKSNAQRALARYHARREQIARELPVFPESPEKNPKTNL